MGNLVVDHAKTTYFADGALILWTGLRCPQMGRLRQRVE